MFDIGFSEILLIFVIALIVLGPEKLPRLAAQAGRLIGRARAMARQFREQLEEEVNLDEVRKAQKAQAKKAAETASSADATSSNAPSSASTSAGDDAAATGSSHNATTDTSAPWHSTQPAASDHHTAQNSTQPDALSTTQPPAEATPFGSYQGPDPADFRADTFSHAHPTNEFGANPFTSSGAAEGSTPQDASTPSEANVAAAQPEPQPAVTEKREPPAEAYAAAKSRDNTPGTDNHGNE